MTKPLDNNLNSSPVVDSKRIQATYSELKKMEVRLDPNPIEYGPKRFNNRIAQVRSMLTRLEQLFLQTSEDLHYFQRVISNRNALYELEKRDLMINDPKCRVGRSQGEREALADVQLRSTIEELQEYKLAAQDLESLMVVIKSKRTDLKDIQGRMRDQMKLIEHDLGMGARWGSRTPPKNVSHSFTEIDDLLADVDARHGVPPDFDDSVDEDDEDPAPHLEEDNTPLLGEEDSEEEDSEEEDSEEEDSEEEDSEEEDLFTDSEEEGSLPEPHTDKSSVSSFLDGLDEALEASEEAPEGPNSDVGIDDLIASFSD